MVAMCYQDSLGCTMEEKIGQMRLYWSWIPLERLGPHCAPHLNQSGLGHRLLRRHVRLAHLPRRCLGTFWCFQLCKVTTALRHHPFIPISSCPFDWVLVSNQSHTFIPTHRFCIYGHLHVVLVIHCLDYTYRGLYSMFSASKSDSKFLLDMSDRKRITSVLKIGTSHRLV